MENMLKEVKHHQQEDLCKTRPAYRQGRNLTAVKVYTVASESQHLFIYGVPKINLRTELKSLCSKYGQLLSLHLVNDHKTEIFTECYHANYQKIQPARVAKKMLDNRSFYGSILHVCYAPEHESLEETRNKLMQRVFDVSKRLEADKKNNMKETDNNWSDEKIQNMNKNRSFKGKWKFRPSTSVEVNNEEQDPLLPCKLLKIDNKSENKTYGPEIPKDFNKSTRKTIGKDFPKEILKLKPSQITKNVNNEKKIVFRNTRVD